MIRLPAAELLRPTRSVESALSDGSVALRSVMSFSTRAKDSPTRAAELYIYVTNVSGSALTRGAVLLYGVQRIPQLVRQSNQMLHSAYGGYVRTS
jgi:hypothetical protein